MGTHPPDQRMIAAHKKALIIQLACAVDGAVASVIFLNTDIDRYRPF